MIIMKAKRLKIGSRIGIVSASDPLPSPDDERLVKGIDNLKAMGFDIVLGKNICSKNPAEKAKDFNEMFRRNDVDAIICSKGGNTAQEVLEFIDWKLVEKNPKIFMGLSDITVLLNAIYAKTGLITFHGNEITQGFGLQFNQYGKDEFEKRLTHAKANEIPANGERKTIIKGVAEGILLGGNIRCLLKLKGTAYWPDFKGAIIMLEAYHLTPKECRTFFSELKELGIFEQVSGVLIGHIYGMQIEHPKDEQMKEIILEFIKDKPVLKCNDFGHNIPNATFPIGARVRVDATNKRIELIEEFVE